MKKNPRELDGLCLENFIREIINDETKQQRTQTYSNAVDFSLIKQQFNNDRVKVNNCEKNVLSILKREKEREEDPNTVRRVDITKLNTEIEGLKDYITEKFVLLQKFS